MLWVGFEPTIPAFERTKTVHALNRTPIVAVEYCRKSTELHRVVLPEQSVTIADLEPVLQLSLVYIEIYF
jgi:hypothetical protein